MSIKHSFQVNDSSAGELNRQQNLSLLRVYTTYRCVLSIILIIGFHFLSKPVLGQLKPVLFSYASACYLLINLLSLAFILFRRSSINQSQLFLHFFIDLLALIAIADSSGGISSGLAILLVVVIAAASVILHPKLATLCAALATIILITDTLRLMGQQHLQSDSLLPSGMLGIVLFAVSFYIQSLSSKIRSSQLLAAQRAEAINRLEELNQLIVQRMHTGILVTAPNGDIRLANQACSELLNDKLSDSKLPKNLHQLLEAWLKNPHAPIPVIKTSEGGTELQTSFSSLDDQGDILMFLEDNRKLVQRAQQIKLASLGRLTASIAHEIRNPLGAISHAAQLLAESEQLDLADQRLSQIIQDHCIRMNEVIENVLQLSRRDRLRPERIDLSSWLKNWRESYLQTREDQPSIEIDAPCSEVAVKIDSSQLQQVIGNLVDNGLRYSQANDQGLRVMLRISIDDSQRAQLDIIDYGRGIEAKLRDKIFEPFFTTESEGTGLGLFIAREMCESNQAHLNYRINEQRQSSFRIAFAHPDKRLELDHSIH